MQHSTPIQPFVKPPDLSRERSLRAGFSLIEVLVATTLLVIIVIIIGMVFRQSSLSWESGISRADGNMLVRTVVGSIERDLRCAVDARAFGYDDAMKVQESQIEFVALLEGSNPTGVPLREPTHISISGGTTAKRIATRLKHMNGSWSADSSTETLILHTEPDDDVQPVLSFDSEPNGSQLPNCVNIIVTMIPSAGFHGAQAASLGRDKTRKTRDDIEVR